MSFQETVARRKRHGVVYIAQGRRSYLVKIGVTHQLGYRLKTLARERGESLRLLATIAGHFQQERYLHERFRELRVEGEWFFAGVELVEFLADLHYEARDSQSVVLF